MQGKSPVEHEPTEEVFVTEEDDQSDVRAKEQPSGRNLGSARSTFSSTLPVEVQEYQQKLDAAPSQLTAFVDFANQYDSGFNGSNYEDEEQTVLDYFEDCARVDFVPLRTVVSYLRSGADSLKISAYLSRNGAYSLRRICGKFTRIEVSYANLTVYGMIELTKSLTQLSETQILTHTADDLPSSDNKLYALKIIDSGIFSSSQLVSQGFPGVTAYQQQAAHLQAYFNLNKLGAAQKGTSQPTYSQAAALLNFNSNQPRPFYQEYPADKGRAPVALPKAALGETVPFHLLLKNLNIAHANPTGMCLYKIIETCKVLEELSLAENALGDEICLQLCYSLDKSQITNLDLTGNQLTDQFLAYLSPLLAGSVVYYLTVRRNYFSAAGAVIFAAFLAEKRGYLERFDIGHNNIGDIGCSFLLALSSGAGFSSSEMYQQGSTLLSSCNNGKSVILPKKLPQSGSGDFHTLSIAHCMAGVITAAYIAHTLQNTQHIDSLDVSGNSFSDAGWYGIMSALAAREAQAGSIGSFSITFYRFLRSDLLPYGAEPIESILSKVQSLGADKLRNLQVLK